MGDNTQLRSDEEQPPPAQIPLLSSNLQNDAVGALHQRQQEIRTSNRLDDSLEYLERFLTCLGFNQSSLLSFSLSWAAFTVVGVLVPVLALELSDCDGCEMYQIKNFEVGIVASQACLAAVSLFCISFNLRKYGIRRFLFVDRYGGQMVRFTDLYVKQIAASMRLLIWWLLPCFILKTVREVIRILYVQHDSRWISVAISVPLTLSWTYVSTISLSASILFHLLCNLQFIHFDDYAKLLERESDVMFLVVTVSQVVTLFQTTVYSGMINLSNGGDFAISAIVQVVGIILCLHAATRISHRAQGIASFACRWHALATCTSTDACLRHSNSLGSMEPLSQSNLLDITFSESDLDSMDYITMPTTTQLASYMSSYHRRQAFMMYLQANPGGITIFGWTVDRGLINTIFFLELTLVTFVLGQTVVFNSA
ncbi:Zinc finger CONSTANS-LIKE 2 -like protein [Gossypium arboreum]|uniref:Zinc finger CONSTANS-LIKE 2-like protein n=1 Tax=Gossypium arboreum TaxID=29729 RepID=A0A0B0P826_GOSAR|nr:Zinc finger CONSTANS-LIKE 2 -like protein [Gossypium arboreum]